MTHMMRKTGRVHLRRVGPRGLRAAMAFGLQADRPPDPCEPRMSCGGDAAQKKTPGSAEVQFLAQKSR
jgi:hypothetical protein